MSHQKEVVDTRLIRDAFDYLEQLWKADAGSSFTGGSRTTATKCGVENILKRGVFLGGQAYPIARKRGPGTSEFLGSSSTYVRPNLVEVDYAKPDKRRVFNVSWSKTRTNVTCCVRVKCRIASALSQYMQSANAECVIRWWRAGAGWGLHHNKTGWTLVS